MKKARDKKGKFELKPRENQSRSTGRLLVFFGWVTILAALAIWVLLSLVIVGSVSWGALKGGIVVAIIAGGGNMIKYGKRHLAKDDAENKIKVKQICPILYFRPFDEEESSPPNTHLRRVRGEGSYEMRLKFALDENGSFIALGNPSDKLPQLDGASKIYSENSLWQEKVINFLAKAQLVVIHIGLSEGLLWELKQVVHRKRPQQAILCIPAGKNTPKYAVEQQYQKFRKQTSALFPRPLPQKIGNALFVYFDKEWNPKLLTPDKSLKFSEIMDQPTSNLERIQGAALNKINLNFAYVSEASYQRRKFFRRLFNFLFLAFVAFSIYLTFFLD